MWTWHTESQLYSAINKHYSILEMHVWLIHNLLIIRIYAAYLPLNLFFDLNLLLPDDGAQRLVLAGEGEPQQSIPLHEPGVARCAPRWSRPWEAGGS